ncbi:tRNA (uridine(34)/cytosine(34)/5-carboxymethylaminomethyluridine(34)-2'-O)-methyltransferase TrmL [Thiohalophilus sp.]|uniref:tRNA (uridine(34)/cytosine(34)/5- carboxymethylaminomethyluridine(34)-2'-O)- methyltransferase TrmL n=1 Tax=Thiohalophilus sp. TaxID=3028392 RepID=UPI0039767299
MFHVVLYQPEIPPNTGNIIRLCANTGAVLHLIEPLGFELDDVRLKRAGLDYHEYADIQRHASFDAFLLSVQPTRLFGFSTKGRRNAFEITYQPRDAFLFGPETRGLPQELREGLGEDFVLRLPMQPTNRSLNLANAVAVIVYEGWRQQGFAGAGNQTSES